MPGNAYGPLYGRLCQTGRQRTPGQALVEFALLLPLLLLLCLGIVDFTRVFAASMLVQDAAREGARVAMSYSKTDANVTDRVIATASPFTVATSDIGICVNTTTCSAGTVNARSSSNSGQSVIVTVQYSIPLASAVITAAIGLSSINLSGTARMVIV